MKSTTYDLNSGSISHLIRWACIKRHLVRGLIEKKTTHYRSHSWTNKHIQIPVKDLLLQASPKIKSDGRKRNANKSVWNDPEVYFRIAMMPLNAIDKMPASFACFLDAVPAFMLLLLLFWILNEWCIICKETAIVAQNRRLQLQLGAGYYRLKGRGNN